MTKNGSEFDATDPAANSGEPQVASRLRRAIAGAGGFVDVSWVSGVPTRSISRYLAGQEMKRSVLVALSDACRVSVEWLATGRGPMRPGEESSPQPPLPEPAAEPVRAAAVEDHAMEPDGLLSVVDFKRLGDAMRYTLDAFEQRGIHPQPERLAEIVIVIYDHLAGPPDTHDPVNLARILSASWVPAHRAHLAKKLRGEEP